MPYYVISLKYSDSSGSIFVEYQSENPDLKQARQAAKGLAEEERQKHACAVRILRVESRAACDRRRAREPW